MSFGHRISLRTLLFVSSFCISPLFLTGCALGPIATDADTPIAGTAIKGKVYGGETPISGQHIYLMAATVSGVGSAGYGLASTSLLTSSVSTNNPGYNGHDSNGYYVLTNASGGFTISSDYTCPASSSQVYIYGLGGNTGSGTNAGAGLMAALGSCGSLSSSTYVLMNELTTVATAYALAGFATDATHVSIPQYSTGTTADTLVATDLQNAFSTVNNLVNIANGTALTTTTAGNGTPDTAQLTTLADILAACVSSYPTNSPANCNTLYNNSGSTGGGNGIIPTNTATAAINIAHHPYVSSTVMSNLYGLAGGTGAPFAGGDSSQPNDFTVGINYTNASLNSPQGIAIDASGDVWVANCGGGCVGNGGNGSVSKFSPAGTVLSGSGYTAGGVDEPTMIAIDLSGNAWVINHSVNSVSALTSSGAALNANSPYTAGGTINSPAGVAVDGSGHIWVPNDGPSFSSEKLVELSSTGTTLFTSSSAAGGIFGPVAPAIDAGGNVWIANENNTLSEFLNTGAVKTGSPFSGGNLNYPNFTAIDSSGNVWIADASYPTGGLSEFSNAGAAITTSGAYTGCNLQAATGLAIDGAGNVWVSDLDGAGVAEFSNSGAPLCANEFTSGGTNAPYYVAIDGSGNVWSSGYNGTISEIVGAATPVVTPLAANLTTPYSKAAAKP